MKEKIQQIRNFLAIGFLIICLCISMAGCADTQSIIDPTSGSVTTATLATTNKTHLPKETDPVTMPSESETIPLKTEITPTETVHIHNYTGAVTEQSCTEGGYTTFTCACGGTYIADQTNARGHNYSSKVKTATCTEKGYTTYTCIICGDSYTDNQTNATGHSWGSWSVTQVPTTTAEGAEQRTCKTCGKTDTRSIAKLLEETKPAYETFSGAIGVYNAHNLPYTDWKGDTEQAAFIEIYTVEKSDRVLHDLAVEFEKAYGFAPSLDDSYNRCTSSCKKLGTYMVNGYSEPRTVYHYTITDKSYIYITNPMYTVYTQNCPDGSIWIGYCVYATMDTIRDERSKLEVQALDQEMYKTFEELIGLSWSQMNTYKEELKLKIGYISEAGTVSSVHSDGLVDVLYVYCRGFASCEQNG